MMPLVLLLLHVVFMDILGAYGTGLNDMMSPEVRIVRMLSNLSHYDKRARPIRNSSQPITIDVTFFPRKLVDLNGEKQTITMSAFLDLVWKDEYFSWNPADYEGVKKVVIPDSDIWKPDIILQDSLGGIDDLSYVMDQVYLNVDHDGNVTWYSSRIFIRACSLDMTYFPFDRQTCKYRFESRTHDGSRLSLGVRKIQNETLSLIALRENVDGEWKFLSGRAWIETAPNIPTWYFYYGEITLQRKPMYFVTNMLCPCMLISFLIPVMFCLPPESGERLSLGTTILVAFCVFQMVIAEVLPRTSDHTPIIVNYLLVMLGSSSLSIVLTILVVHIHLKGGATMPRWLRRLLFSCLARILCMSRDVNQTMKKSRDSYANYGVYSKRRTSKDVEPEGECEISREDSKMPFCQDEHSLMTSINRVLNEHLKMKNESIEKEDAREQWMMAARILDRFFLILYFITNILAAGIFLSILRNESHE